MSIISTATRQLNELSTACTGEPKCVHRSLLMRALIIIKKLRPDSEDVFSPVIRTLMASSKRPDRKGDYEKGMGRHYYCTRTPSGKTLSPVNSYYRSGTRNFAKSARVMFEENYTMALTMYRAGFTKQWADHLGRAVHMLSDMCCLPHTASMTYFSTAGKLHKAYENLAELIYPDQVPLQTPQILPEIFTSRSSFADDLNAIAVGTSQGLDDLLHDPFSAICSHLQRTELILAAFLIRFLDDIRLPDRDTHCITTNSGCQLLKGTPPLTVKVTDEGISFHGVNPSPKSKINVTSTIFYAAHRHDGLFTLSPARDSKGVVLEVSGGKFLWKKFDPVHGEQLFRL